MTIKLYLSELIYSSQSFEFRTDRGETVAADPPVPLSTAWCFTKIHSLLAGEGAKLISCPPPAPKVVFFLKKTFCVMRFAECVKCCLNAVVASYRRWKAITALANSLAIPSADVSPKFLLLTPSTSI